MNILFQFTPLREGRRAAARIKAVNLIFQFTPLREGRRFMWAMQFSPNLFQFTPLREGRRLDVGFNVSRPNISIHAPPRGATI